MKNNLNHIHERHFVVNLLFDRGSSSRTQWVVVGIGYVKLIDGLQPRAAAIARTVRGGRGRAVAVDNDVTASGGAGAVASGVADASLHFSSPRTRSRIMARTSGGRRWRGRRRGVADFVLVVVAIVSSTWWSRIYYISNLKTKLTLTIQDEEDFSNSQ